MNRLKWLVIVLSVPMFILASAAPALADAPRVRVGRGTSSNWSGYAALTNLESPVSGSVTDVKGTWVVPSTTGPNTGYSAAWVGIDGYSSKTVEQIGTEQDWRSSGSRHYAWWEMYPKMAKIIPGMTIHAGDTMGAEVKWIGARTFQLSMTDFTTGQTFTTLQKGNGKRTSAEWIVEAPSSGGVLPLVRFDPVTFTGCSATIGGHTGAINDSAWQNDPITLVNSSGTPLATPSTVKANGSSFTVTRD